MFSKFLSPMNSSPAIISFIIMRHLLNTSNGEAISIRNPSSLCGCCCHFLVKIAYGGLFSVVEIGAPDSRAYLGKLSSLVKKAYLLISLYVLNRSSPVGTQSLISCWCSFPVGAQSLISCWCSIAHLLLVLNRSSPVGAQSLSLRLLSRIHLRAEAWLLECIEMDRSWMYGGRTTKQYTQGVEEFIKCATAYQVKNRDDWILCPCCDCDCSKRFRNVNRIREHLICRGFKVNYTRWIWHGESIDHGASTSHSDHNGNDSLGDNDVCHEDSVH